MTSGHLKELQAPLKQKYKTDPSSAFVVLKATGKLAADVACDVESMSGTIKAGLHPATGGNGLETCSGDMLLQALVACAGVTMTAVATAIGINITEGRINAEGDLDFRGTLGVSKDAPVGFKTIRLHYVLKTDASEEQLASLLKLTERYCVVYQTLAKGVRIDIKLN